MEAIKLKYTIIKSRDQYDTYCRVLEELVSSEIDDAVQDEIDLLTLLIETFDEAHRTFTELDPIALLRSFMAEHDLRPQQLVALLGVSKGYVSDILNYKKGLSKEVIRKLATHFKVRQEAFNRPYKLKIPEDQLKLNSENITKVSTQQLARH